MTDYIKKNFERSKGLYPTKQSLILPLLYEAQEQDGYVTKEAMKRIAEETEVSPAFVESVASFYTMYFKKKAGTNIIAVCTNISCELCKGSEIIELIKGVLKIDIGGTTENGLFTLLEVECLGSCGTAPVVQVNNEYVENATFEKIAKIIEKIIAENG